MQYTPEQLTEMQQIWREAASIEQWHDMTKQFGGMGAERRPALYQLVVLTGTLSGWTPKQLTKMWGL